MSNFCLYLKLIMALQYVDNESPQADAIRDAMDKPWRGMTPQEQDKARVFSECLDVVECGK